MVQLLHLSDGFSTLIVTLQIDFEKVMNFATSKVGEAPEFYLSIEVIF